MCKWFTLAWQLPFSTKNMVKAGGSLGFNLINHGQPQMFFPELRNTRRQPDFLPHFEAQDQAHHPRSGRVLRTVKESISGQERLHITAAKDVQHS